MQIKGKCIAVLPIETGVGKKGEWKKLTFVIEYGEEYPKQVALQLFGDKVQQAPAVGDELTCHFSLESREYNGKYYTQVNAWKVEGFTGNLNKPKKNAIPDDAFDNLPKTDINNIPTGGSATDDLPF